MGKTTGIAWTDATWNPWQGCTKVSAGCKNCYMFREKEWHGQDPMTVIRSAQRTFDAPLHWNLPAESRIFVCSWSDFFHKHADDWREEAIRIMLKLPQYNFLIPTKRIERAEECMPYSWRTIGWPQNIWLGVSAEDQATFNTRVSILADIPAAVKWVSAEPLLGPIEMTQLPTRMAATINWVVIGGESGPHCRPMDIRWAADLLEECEMCEIPAFMKQLGGWPNKRDQMEDFPEGMRIREFPV